MAIWKTFSASKEDISDAERIRAAQQGDEITTRFIVRYSPDTVTIGSSDKLQCAGQAYSILGTKEIGTRDGIEITASATRTPLSGIPAEGVGE